MVDFARFLNGTPGAALQDLRRECESCRQCPHASTRQQAVFQRGDERSTLVFVGEAPGAEEDERGVPFVGDAGKLLDKMIAKMLEYALEIGVEVQYTPYICNVLKCRPPGNKLLKDGSDIAACTDWLWKQLRLLPNVRVIVALGRVAAQTLLRTDEPIGSLRAAGVEMAMGVETLLPAFTVVPTWHPAYLARQPNNVQPRKESWEDLKRAVEALK